MNKITIPALLLGVVMIAGAFAFMPVQEASTVHTTVLAGTSGTEMVTSTPGAFAIDTASTFTITVANLPGDGYSTLNSIFCTYDDGTGAADADITAVTLDGLLLVDPVIGGTNMVQDDIFTQANGGGYLTNLGLDFVVDIVIAADADDADANNVIDCFLGITGPDVATYTAVWT